MVKISWEGAANRAPNRQKTGKTLKKVGKKHNTGESENRRARCDIRREIMRERREKSPEVGESGEKC